MTLAGWIVVGCAVVATAYQGAQLLAAHRFFRRARRAAAAHPPGRHLPPVTVLKPLKGPGLDLYANLASFCRQRYPRYQLVFGVEDPDDPAVAVVQRLRRDFPDRDIVLAVGRAPGANRKVANLTHMMRHARYDVLVLSDADIRVRPDYLRAMVAPLADPAVGLTTCLYRGRGYFGLPSVLESLFINTDFIPMVMMAQWVQEFRYAYGASIAVRREALDRFGGFPVIADHLADDYLLGNKVLRAGYRLVLLPYVVETVLDAVTLRDVFRHQLRWARTYRVQEPLGWFCSIITHTTLWSTLAVVATGGSLLGWSVLAAGIATRLAALAGIMRLLRERDTPRHLWLVPLKDLCYSAMWVLSWTGRRVTWSGADYTIARDGRLLPVGAPAPVPAAAVEERALYRAAGPQRSR